MSMVNYMSGLSAMGWNYLLMMTTPVQHRWGLLGNYPVFFVVMIIHHPFERIWIILITPHFLITYTTMKNIIQVNHLIYIYNHE